jgi:hypothetical protein
MIILFLPVVPRYLIEFKSFGWAAIPVLIFYMLLGLEIFRRGRMQRGFNSTLPPRGEMLHGSNGL